MNLLKIFTVSLSFIDIEETNLGLLFLIDREGVEIKGKEITM